MDITKALPLLGGLSPQLFMKRYWQRKPLLVRGAMPGIQPPLSRPELFALAGRDEVESRLVVRKATQWRFRRGPFGPRSLPPRSQSDWTLLVQGVDLHRQAAHDLMARFRFVPQARLDDVMISYATDGGGVGPHFDSYDVFLLQAQGRRRWRIGRQTDLSLRPDLPFKVLAHFEPEEEHVLDPGDLLYLPPRYAHEGVALGECQTCSIGFRAPARGELVREMLQRLSDNAADLAGDALYRDAGQPASAAPGEVPMALQDFARDALHAALDDARVLDRALGEYLTEPKASVWFEGAGHARRDDALRDVILDRRTRMMYDALHVFINGESYRASGRDRTLMRALADQRRLDGAKLIRATAQARSLIESWREAGWLHAAEAPT